MRHSIRLLIVEHGHTAALGLIAYAICGVIYTILSEDNTRDADSVLWYHLELQKNAHKNPAVVQYMGKGFDALPSRV
jgi:hypothetical protein